MTRTAVRSARRTLRTAAFTVGGLSARDYL